MACQHGIERFAQYEPEGLTIGPPLRHHPTECVRCDAIDTMQQKVEVGMRVYLSEFFFEAEGTITRIDPCDGNCCEYFPHPGETCNNDYIIIDTDDDMVFFRYQISLVNV